MVDQGTTALVSTHFMDEAERCHALAILDKGALVASGAPKNLMSDLEASVVEVETEQPREVRDSLLHFDPVKDAAQFGTRLHVLVGRGVSDPVGFLEATCEARELRASLKRVNPNLEDAFVMATRGVRS